MDINSYLDMGGYAAYVWPAYGLAAIVMVGLLLTSLRSLRAREAELKLLQDSIPGRAARRAARARTNNVEAQG